MLVVVGESFLGVFEFRFCEIVFVPLLESLYFLNETFSYTPPMDIDLRINHINLYVSYMIVSSIVLFLFCINSQLLATHTTNRCQNFCYLNKLVSKLCILCLD